MEPKLSVEPRLRPPELAPLYLRTELFVVALLGLLLLVLAVPWAQSGVGGRVYGDADGGVTVIEYARDFVAGMIIPWMLPAMGLVLVLRQGSIDLSVWMAFALAAAAGARMMEADWHPVVILAAVVGAGVALGLIHALAVVRLRLPGWGATLITATIGVSLAAALTGGEVIAVGMDRLARWPGANRTELITGSFFIVALLAVAPLSLRSHWAHRPRPRGSLAAALVGSGVLSCLGGLCWLLKSGRTCMPGHIVGDLRVLAAAVLAGAVCLRGRGHSLLSCALVPPAMLVASVWWLFVCPTPTWPVEVNLLALAAMVWAAHWAWRQAARPTGGIRLIWAVLAASGIVSLAATAATEIPDRDVARTFVGLLLWLIGLGGALVEWLKQRKSAKAPERPTLDAPTGG